MQNLAYYLIEEDRFRVKQVFNNAGKDWIACEVGLRHFEEVKGVTIPSDLE